MIFNGIERDRLLNDNEKRSLLGSDGHFWAGEFRTQDVTGRRLDLARVLPDTDGKPFWTSVHRVHLPASAKAEAVKLFGDQVPVIETSC
jgi:hypothetical protein